MPSSKNEMNIPSTIFVYEDLSTKNLDLIEIKRYLKRTLGEVKVELREDFISHYRKKDIEEIAKKLATIKVRDLRNPNIDFKPLNGEVQFEKKLLTYPENRLTGVLYDGFKLSRVFRNLISKSECDLRFLHIAFTNRLFGTLDEWDRRYHARVIILGYPSLISTTGIVEAPAKPREFYHLKQEYTMRGSTNIPIDIIKEKLKGRFIEYDDERLTEVMKGYVMQAIFYHVTFEAFCEDKNCRLYNAHWQEEVINAQLGNREFCERHEKFIRKLRDAINKRAEGET